MKQSLCLIFEIFFLVQWISPSNQQNIQVAIKQGTINGFRDYGENKNGFYSFLGIPYARPPIDELRFKDPVPHTGWSGVLEAQKYGPACPQWDQVTSTVIGDEDCLTLNVFTHRFGYMGGSANPVIVFIHGGGFMRGSSASYGPAKLLSVPVVLVTVNYRLGALGFLSTEDSAAPGNYGMLDLVVALRWVKENILDLGGDPQRITIVGNSAGAAAVSHLIVSPLARGLFGAAITQSGSALCDWAVEEEPFNYAAILATDLGCSVDSSADIVGCLRQKSAAEIIAAQQSHCTFAGFFPMRTAPVVDRLYRNQPFLPDLPENLLRNGEFSPVPLISGIVQNDGLLFLLKMLQENREQIALDPNFLEDTLLPEAVDVMTDAWYTPNKIEMIKKFYFKDVDLQNIDEVILPFTNLLSDILFFSCNDKMLKLHSKFAPAYMYVFSHRGNNSYSDALIKTVIDMNIKSPILSQGASHVDDVLYLFNMPNIGPSKLAEDKKIQDIMVFLFSTFAERNTPNQDPPSSFVFWQTLRETSLTFLNITSYSYVGLGFRQFQLSIYDYINNLPPSPEKYTETRESYYIATWVLVTLCIIFILACISLIILLIRAARKRTYSTKTLDNPSSMGMHHPKVE